MHSLKIQNKIKSIQIYIGIFNKKLKHKIVIIFLPISLNVCFGCSKEQSQLVGSFEYPLSETVLLSTQNICFG